MMAVLFGLKNLTFKLTQCGVCRVRRIVRRFHIQVLTMNDTIFKNNL